MSFVDPIKTLSLSPLRMSKQQQLAACKMSSRSPLSPNKCDLQGLSTPGQGHNQVQLTTPPLKHSLLLYEFPVSGWGGATDSGNRGPSYPSLTLIGTVMNCRIVLPQVQSLQPALQPLVSAHPQAGCRSGTACRRQLQHSGWKLSGQSSLHVHQAPHMLQHVMAAQVTLSDRHHISLQSLS